MDGNVIKRQDALNQDLKIEIHDINGEIKEIAFIDDTEDFLIIVD